MKSYVVLYSLALFVHGSVMIILSFNDVALLFGFLITMWIHLLLLFSNKENYAWDILFVWIVVGFVGYMTKTSKYEEVISTVYFFSLPLQFLIDLVGLLAAYEIRIPINNAYERFLVASALFIDLIHCCDWNPFLYRINGITRLVLFLFVHTIEYVQMNPYAPDILPTAEDPYKSLDIRMNIFLVTHYILYTGNLSVIPLLIIHVILWRFRHKRMGSSNHAENGVRK